MPPKTPVDLRDATPFVRILRNYLLGRKGKNPLRFQPLMAARTQPPPNLPDGPAHALSNNYYCLHDARREMIPPVVVADNTYQALQSGTEAQSKETSVQARRPGNVYQWD